MTPEHYKVVASALGIGSLIALALAVGYLAAGIVGWRGPHRKRRLVRMAMFAALWLGLVASLYATLFVFAVPGLQRELRERIQLAQAQRHAGTSLIEVGSPAPPVSMTTADGRRIELAELRGKLVLLNFFATWCGPCLQELPHVQELWNTYQGRDDFELLVIGREETTETVTEFRKQHGYSFPIAADPDRAVYDLFATEFIPRTYLIGPDGIVCFAAIGFDEAEFATLRRELDKRLTSR